MKEIVVIPAYREEATITTVIQSVKRVLPGCAVLVIDDGSPDSTGIHARQSGAFVLKFPYNVGIGGAIQMGLKFAVMQDYDIIVRLDGDGQHPPEAIPLLLAPVAENIVDVAFGSRFCAGAVPPKIGFARRIGIFVFRVLTTWFTRQKITDPTSGYMVMNRKAASFLATNLEHDYPEVDARVLLARAGFRMKEYPINMRTRQGGISSIDTWSAVYYMFKVTVACLAANSRKLNPAYTRMHYSSGPNSITTK